MDIAALAGLGGAATMGLVASSLVAGGLAGAWLARRGGLPPEPAGGEAPNPGGRLEFVLAATHAAVWDSDLLTGNVWWSDSFYRMLGLSQPPAEISGSDLWAASIHTDDRDRVLTGIRDHIRGGAEYHKDTLRLIRHDGSLIWVQCLGRCDRDADGRAVRYAGVVTDITRLHDQEERVRIGEERLRSILEASPIAVNITTLDGRFLYSNPQLARTLGIPHESIRAVNAKDLYVDPGQRADLLERFEKEGRFRDVELAFRRPDGEEVWLLSSWDTIDFDGESALLTWLYDITDRKHSESATQAAKVAAERALTELREAQESLIQAEAMASLGQLVAGVAHDLNTPIGIAVTAASHLNHEVGIIRQAFETNAMKRSQLVSFFDMLEETARLVTANMDRAADLVQSFKRIAVDQSSGERRPFDLAGYVDEIVHSLGPRLKRTAVTISVDCDDGITMDSYPGALSQVLTNLIVNALVHAYDDGSQEGTIAVAAHAPSPETVVITVSDNGIGMTPDIRSRVFEAFFSTRRDRGGSGLGLHLVLTLATGPLGGTVAVESQPGAGTCFTLTFPLHAPQ